MGLENLVCNNNISNGNFMRVTKYGHSCLFVEEEQAKILIDPGIFCFKDANLKPEDLPECNVLLITHSHSDHFDLGALKIILQKSKPVILTTAEVRKVLAEHSIVSEVLQAGDERLEYGVVVHGVGGAHETIAEHIALPAHLGFLIAKRLFHPGDCLHPTETMNPEILAVPTAAPWMKISEGIDFVQRLKPKIVFPIHDAILKNPELVSKHFESAFQNSATKFIILKIGEAVVF